MLKANKKTMIITSIMILLPIMAGIMLWDRLPDVMATHWGMDSEPNGYSSKAFAVYGLPLLLLAVHWLCVTVTLHDPKKQNISPKIFGLVMWICPIVSIFGSAVIYGYSLGYETDISFYSMLLVGLMFIIVGNFLPKSRQNYTVGIKLPWTLANEENWNRTHRLAGFLWVAGGVILVIAALTGYLSSVRAPWLLFTLLLALTLVPCVYSYLLYLRQEK